jgi:hypothetical protein
LQSRIVELTAKRKRLLKSRCLSMAWIDSIFESLLQSALPLTLNVFLNRFQRRTAYSDGEIAWTPQVTAPKPILEPLELLKQPPRSYTFKAVHKFRDLLIRLHPHNDVNKVNFILSRYQFNVCLFAKLFQYLSQPIANLSSYHGAAIFNAPNNVVLKLMYRMAAALKVVFQTRYYTATNLKNKRNVSVSSGYFALQPIGLIAGIQPAQAREIHPPRERRGLLSQLLDKKGGHMSSLKIYY